MGTIVAQNSLPKNQGFSAQSGRVYHHTAAELIGIVIIR